VLFERQSVDAVKAAVARFEENSQSMTAAACRENSQRFAPERFRRELVLAFDEARSLCR
jgi:hypothetical protein